MTKNTNTTHIIFPLSIEDITFKYLFDDKESEYNGKYFNYYLVDDSISRSNMDELLCSECDLNIYLVDNTPATSNIDRLLCKVESKDKQETYEMKLISKNGTLYVMSDFLDGECLEYELERFDGSKSIILYKKFHDGELYIHIDLAE